MAKSSVILVLLESASLRVLLPSADSEGYLEEIVQTDGLAAWLQAKGSDIRHSSCVVAIPADDCLCASFQLPQATKRGHAELTYMAEQYLPLAAESLVASFCVDGQSVWFATTAIDPLKRVLQVLQTADVNVVSLTPLPILALAAIKQSDDSAGVTLFSPMFGEDRLSWNAGRKLTSWVHTVPDESADWGDSEPLNDSASIRASSQHFNWDLSTCVEGARQILNGRARPIVEFLSDPALKEYRSYAGERPLQLWTGLVMACLVAITAACLWKTGEYQARAADLDSELDGLLSSAIPHLPAERRSILLARSHRNQLRAMMASAATLQRPPDPENLLVKVLRAVATLDSNAIEVEEIRVADDSCLLSVRELPQPQVNALIEQLKQSGMHAVMADKSTLSMDRRLMSWTITLIDPSGGR